MKLKKLSTVIVLILCLLVGYACSKKGGPAITPSEKTLVLEKTSLTLTEDKNATVKITSGNGNYQVSAFPTDIVTATVKDDKEITITALKKGTTKLTVTDAKNKIANIAVQVAEETPTLDPRDADGKFSLAIIGDTQREVFPHAYTLFTERTAWIAAQKDALDIRGVLHMGDVVNWDGSPVRNPWIVDAAGQQQYIYAAQALKNLRDAGIPTSLAIGNHDSMATGGGNCTGTSQNGTNCGSARYSNDGNKGLSTYVHMRMTNSFNHYLDDAKLIPTWVPFENNKVDNGYWTFEAAGAKWLVITLELWPRTVVTTWFKGIIAANSDKNIIIHSHFIFNSACNVYASADFSEQYSYGDNSPARIWRELVEPYSNVKVVSSGHVTGYACSKTHTLPNGNKVVSILMDNANGSDFNPTRILEIDVKNNTATTYWYATRNNASSTKPVYTGMNFIKK